MRFAAAIRSLYGVRAPSQILCGEGEARHLFRFLNLSSRNRRAVLARQRDCKGALVRILVCEKHSRFHVNARRFQRDPLLRERVRKPDLQNRADPRRNDTSDGQKVAGPRVGDTDLLEFRLPGDQILARLARDHLLKLNGETAERHTLVGWKRHCCGKPERDGVNLDRLLFSCFVCDGDLHHGKRFAVHQLERDEVVLDAIPEAPEVSPDSLQDREPVGAVKGPIADDGGKLPRLDFLATDVDSPRGSRCFADIECRERHGHLGNPSVCHDTALRLPLPIPPGLVLRAAGRTIRVKRRARCVDREMNILAALGR